MKSLLLLSLALLLNGCPSASQPAGAETERVHLAIEGMTCENCVQGITGTLNATKGVTSCEVSLEKKSADIEFDPTALTREDLIRRIDHLGYKATLHTPPVESATKNGN